MSTNFGSSEIILIAEAVAREKNIPKDSVLEALEDAIRVAARRKYGHENTIRAEIDRRTGEIRLFREMLVVDENAPVIELTEEEMQDPAAQMAKITLRDAKHKKDDAQIGDIISEPLPPLDLGRVAAQSAKQVITHRVKEIERDRNYNDFKDKVGKIVSGVIEKIERGNVIVKLGSAEAMIKNEFLIKEERMKVRSGDRIRALVYEVNKDSKLPQVQLSRTHKEFLSELFAQEVPEIYDRIIEVKAIARDPGLRSKIAVFSTDPSIDPVGSCVGMRGARVQAVINELNGEKIDVIQWSNDPATLVINALSPAEVTKVIIDEDNSRIEVVVPDEQLSIAIGKRGQNVRLASELVGWNIDVLTEESESKRRTEEFSAITQKFMSALDLEEILAQLLASEGYVSIQDLADAKTSDLANIEGLDEAIAEELITRAKEYAQTHEDAFVAPAAHSTLVAKLDPAILKIEGITEELAIELFQNDVKTLEDLADLARDEFLENAPSSKLSDSEIDKVIMDAREKTYFKSEK